MLSKKVAGIVAERNDLVTFGDLLNDIGCQIAEPQNRRT
jgi:hypothetical protein